jgi:hypothetical protein
MKEKKWLRPIAERTRKNNGKIDGEICNWSLVTTGRT